MKVFLMILVTVVASFSFIMSAGAQDWEFYCRYGDSFFYDSDNIICPYEEFENIVSVWQKTLYDDESIGRIADHLGPRYADLKESISLVEVDCRTVNVRVKAVTYYDSKEQVIYKDTNNYRGTNGGWKAITSKSSFSDLYRVVCRTKKDSP